jgi:hypothetical protein
MSSIDTIENKTESATLSLKAIELIKGSIDTPPLPEVALVNFSFNINIESKADEVQKLIFVIVSIEIKNEPQTQILGSIAASCVYLIDNFSDVVTKDSQGNLVIPKPLVDTLNSISISTTRGIMFSTFKGTFLHNAILPIINPQIHLQPAQQ